MHEIQPVSDAYRDQRAAFLTEHWGGVSMITRGKVYDDLTTHPGFMVWQDDKLIALLTYFIENGECELTSIYTEVQGQGIGDALLKAYIEAAKTAGCHRAFLITTNDNLRALDFYQKRGFVLKALYPNALAESRRLKPTIPLIGFNGIPLRDELELEMLL